MISLNIATKIYCGLKATDKLLRACSESMMYLLLGGSLSIHGRIVNVNAGD